MKNLPKSPDFLDKEQDHKNDFKSIKKTHVTSFVEDTYDALMSPQKEKIHSYEEYEDKINDTMISKKEKHHSILDEDGPQSSVVYEKIKVKRKVSISNILTLLVVSILLGFSYMLKYEADKANEKSSKIDSKLIGLTQQITALSMENEKLTKKINQTKIIPIEEIRGSDSLLLDTQKKNFELEKNNLEKRIKDLELEAQKREELIIKMRQNMQRDNIINSKNNRPKTMTNNEDMREALKNRSKIESKNLGRYDEFSDPID